MKKQKRSSKRKKRDAMRMICWGVIPLGMLFAITADTLGFFHFTRENLIVIALLLLVVLLF